jgi:uncharacterized tellurite resistance protein B-like protein
MLKAIRDFFALAHSSEPPATDPADPEQGLRLAAAALLFEVSRIDGRVESEEVTLMRTAIQSSLGLSLAQTEELMAQAERRSREAISVYELTSVLDREMTPEQKKRMVELLWLVAFADTRKDPLEEQLVRRIAGLLHVPHPDFIDAKIRAREARSA